MDPYILPVKELVNNLDIDKETVEIFAIVCSTVVAVAAMVFDGAVGDAVGTLLLTGGTALVSYYVGLKKCEVKK